MNWNNSLDCYIGSGRIEMLEGEIHTAKVPIVSEERRL